MWHLFYGPQCIWYCECKCFLDSGCVQNVVVSSDVLSILIEIMYFIVLFAEFLVIYTYNSTLLYELDILHEVKQATLLSLPSNT